MGACNSNTKKNEKKENLTITINNPNEAQKPTASKSSKPPKNAQTVKEPEKCLVIVKYDNEVILKENFEITQTLNDVVMELPKDNNSEYEILSDKNENLIAKTYLQLRELFPSSTTVNLTINYVGLDVPKDSISEYAKDLSFVGSVILDNAEFFSVIRYDVSEGKASTFNYDLDANNEMKTFGLFSALCNGKNTLYISGGEKEENIYYNTFYSIDLKNLTNDNIAYRKLPDLITPRSWHSMIYVPNKYVFIVGGNENKTVEMYDTEADKVTKDSELCEFRSEPTLCLINNTFLYAFCGFILNQSFVSSIERCNLRQRERKWEVIDYEKDDKVEFSPSFFGVGFYKDSNDIILLGSNDNNSQQNKSYIYTHSDDKDSMKIFETNESIVSVFREKFFIPIDEKTSLVIPLYSQEISVVFLNYLQGEIVKTTFQEVEE